MRKHTLTRWLLQLALAVTVLGGGPATAAEGGEDAEGNPRVALDTSAGTIVVELDPTRAPQTVANFLDLVEADFYDGLIFHRVVANFVIQGGGYTPDMVLREAPRTVPNESFNGLSNRKGTIAMARLTDPDSADAQFYINVRDNGRLDARPGEPGYTVFGRVVAGMDVVVDIELTDTGLRKGMAGVPLEPVVISEARRL